MDNHSLSPQVAQQAVWLSSLLPYEQAAQVLTRIGGQVIPASTLWEHTPQVGQDWFERQEQTHVPVERTQWKSERYHPQQRQSIGVDGGMVNVRGEGWKEFKVGAIAAASATGGRGKCSFAFLALHRRLGWGGSLVSRLMVISR